MAQGGFPPPSSATHPAPQSSAGLTAEVLAVLRALQQSMHGLASPPAPAQPPASSPEAPEVVQGGLPPASSAADWPSVADVAMAKTTILGRPASPNGAGIVAKAVPGPALSQLQSTHVAFRGDRGMTAVLPPPSSPSPPPWPPSASTASQSSPSPPPGLPPPSSAAHPAPQSGAGISAEAVSAALRELQQSMHGLALLPGDTRMAAVSPPPAPAQPPASSPEAPEAAQGGLPPTRSAADCPSMEDWAVAPTETTPPVATVATPPLPSPMPTVTSASWHSVSPISATHSFEVL